MMRDAVRVPLRLGPLADREHEVQRSGFRWLCEDGHLCRPGEVVAWCNIGLARRPGFTARAAPFRDEPYDFQVALATRVGGYLSRESSASRGGFLDLQQYYATWEPGALIGHLDCAPGDVPGDPEDVGALRMLLLAGRRVTDHAEVRSGLLTGWHDRSRAWWSEGDGDGAGGFGTVLSLGICELLGVIKGDRGAFLELFASVPGPAHVAFVPDDVLVPTAGVLLSQIRRTEADRQAIVEDLAGTFGAMLASNSRGGLAAASDWLFAGCLLKALLRSPMTERYDVLTPSGVGQVGPADAVLLSMNAEPPYLLRHRRLGYAVNCHAFRIQQAGPAMARWLKAEFETVRRTPDDIRRDYLELIDAIAARTGAQVLILNSMSSVGLEDVFDYSLFDRPLRDSLASVRAKEMNLMLIDVARRRDISIVDVDAIAADLGAGRHLPDGVHQSGEFQREVRAQIVSILRDRGVAGFVGEGA